MADRHGYRWIWAAVGRGSLRSRTAASKGASFAACEDAKSKRLWLKEPLGEVQPGNSSTQRRKIERAGCLLGLSVKLSSAQAERIRETLDLPGLKHEKARREYGTARGLHERGEAIVSVLGQLRRDDELWARLLQAGLVSGLWGQPWLWEPRLNHRLSPRSKISWASQHPP
jgi:hypothetical protein